MNARFFVVLTVPIPLGLATAAVAAIPASFTTASVDAFETDGDLFVEVGYAGASMVATLTVDVEDCGTFTYTSTTSGSTARVASTTTWSLDLDLSSCQDAGPEIERTHHCDGYGNTFETCELVDEGATGADRAVTLSLQLANRAGVALCNTDVDGDGDKECDVASGTLLAGAGQLTELYVPDRYWNEETDGTWTCESRSEGHGARNPDDQGGSSCEDLGL